ncbi:MAG: hypothetical protein JWR50_2352 [Mucilaginibacter sp.]|nr:hypothetical protein [Mucilaginibacter sp.]
MLIIPLYLHYINGSVYGAWLATGNILTWITIVDPGVAGVLLQRVSFSIGKGDKKEVGLAITSGIIISSFLFVVALSAGFLLSLFIAKIAKIDGNYRDSIIGAFRIAIWGTAFSLLADTFRNIILSYQKTKWHGILLYSTLIASIALNIILLVFHFGIYALAYTSLFRGVLTFAFALIYSLILIKRNGVKFDFNLKYLKSFSNVFAFTFSSSLFETIASNIDLILVSRYLGPHAVTVLDLSRRPVRMVSGLANNVTISMLPSLPHLFGTGDKKKISATVLRVWTIIFWISGFIIGGFIIFNYSFNHNWVGSQFWIGNTNNIVLCISILLFAIGYNLSNITLSMGDIQNNSIITIIRSIAYLIALFLLIKFFGLLGVVLAFFVPVFIMIGYYPQKLYNAVFLDKEGSKLLNEGLLLTAIMIACIVVSLFFKIELSWLKLFARALIYSIVFLMVLFCSSKLFRSEVTGIYNLVKLKFKK